MNTLMFGLMVQKKCTGRNLYYSVISDDFDEEEEEIIKDLLEEGFSLSDEDVS